MDCVPLGRYCRTLNCVISSGVYMKVNWNTQSISLSWVRNVVHRWIRLYCPMSLMFPALDRHRLSCSRFNMSKCDLSSHLHHPPLRQDCDINDNIAFHICEQYHSVEKTQRADTFTKGTPHPHTALCWPICNKLLLAADFVSQMHISTLERSLFSQMRFGILISEFEVGRYRQKPLEERLCYHCKNEIQDKLHFFICV